MGSKITRSIFKKERAIKPTPQSTDTATRYFSFVLYLYSAFTIGYIDDIDYILRNKIKDFYQYQPGEWYKYLQILINCFSPIFIGIFVGLIGFPYFIIRSSLICFVSQILIYFAISYTHIGLMLTGEIIFNISSIGILICLLGLTKKNIPKQYSVIFIAFLLSIVNIGQHSSYVLSPIISKSSISGVYIVSGLFGMIALMGIFIIYVFEQYVLTKRIKGIKKNYTLQKVNFNMASFKLMASNRFRNVFKSNKIQLFTCIIAGLLLSIIDTQKVQEYTQNHLIVNGIICLISVFYAISFYQFGKKSKITFISNLFLISTYIYTQNPQNGYILIQAIIRLNEVFIVTVLSTILKQQLFTSGFGFYLTMKAIGQLLIYWTNIETYIFIPLIMVILSNIVLLIRSQKNDSIETGIVQQFIYDKIER